MLQLLSAGQTGKEGAATETAAELNGLFPSFEECLSHTHELQEIREVRISGCWRCDKHGT